MDNYLWAPSHEESGSSQMTLFSAAAGIPEEDLHEWSVKNPSEFWDLVWRHFQVI